MGVEFEPSRRWRAGGVRVLNPCVVSTQLKPNVYTTHTTPYFATTPVQCAENQNLVFFIYIYAGRFLRRPA